MPQTKDERDPMAVDRQFFAALVDGSVETLDRVLAEDFILIDVMRGAEIAKPVLLTAIGSGQLKFDTITPLDARVRRYGSAAVITGHTRMNGNFDGTPFQADSRYTHVYIEQLGRWRLVSAQGTPISPG